MQPLSRAVRGGTAGFIATLPMTAFMVSFRFLSRDGSEVAPDRIIRNLGRRLGVVEAKAEPPFQVVLVAHFAYGTLMGAVYSVLGRRALRNFAFRGPAYGLLVWVMSYAGWLPVLRLFPPPLADLGSRSSRVVLSHLVWGSSLEIAHNLLERGTNKGATSNQLT